MRKTHIAAVLLGAIASRAHAGPFAGTQCIYDVDQSHPVCEACKHSFESAYPLSAADLARSFRKGSISDWRVLTKRLSSGEPLHIAVIGTLVPHAWLFA